MSLLLQARHKWMAECISNSLLSETDLSTVEVSLCPCSSLKVIGIHSRRSKLTRNHRISRWEIEVRYKNYALTMKI